MPRVRLTKKLQARVPVDLPERSLVLVYNKVETLSDDEWATLQKEQPALVRSLDVLPEPVMSARAKRAFEAAAEPKKAEKAKPKKATKAKATKAKAGD